MLFRSTALTRENANQFAQALREGDITARKATGFKGATLENTMTPKQMMVLQNLQSDLARRVSADELGREYGSNTFQNFAMQDLAEAAGYPGRVLNKLVNRVPAVGEFLTDIAEKGVENKEMLMRNEIADILLNPKRTAEMLRRQIGRAHV